MFMFICILIYKYYNSIYYDTIHFTLYIFINCKLVLRILIITIINIWPGYPGVKIYYIIYNIKFKYIILFDIIINYIKYNII